MAKSIINCYEGDLGRILRFSVNNNFSSMAILVCFLHKDIKWLQKTLNIVHNSCILSFWSLTVPLFQLLYSTEESKSYMKVSKRRQNLHLWLTEPLRKTLWGMCVCCVCFSGTYKLNEEKGEGIRWQKKWWSVWFHGLRKSRGGVRKGNAEQAR